MIETSGQVSYSVSDDVASAIPTREVTGRKRLRDDGVVSVHVIAGKILFLLDSFFTMAGALDANAAPSGRFEEV